jgi:Sec-independent protein secretion pathway component TatC
MALFRRRRPAIADPDEYRMTLGDHLEELRGCIARSLIYLVVLALACIWPAKYLLELIARPVIIVLRRYNQAANFLQTGPAETLMVYVKVVLIFGLILAAPLILRELWRFVAAGLYKHVRRWVQRLFPAWVGLFFLGVLFMYAFALLLSLNFLVWFSEEWLPAPSAEPTWVERKLLGMPDPVQPPAGTTAQLPPAVPLLAEDPEKPPIGSVWVNVRDSKLKVQWPDRTYSLQLAPDGRHGLVTTHFKLGEYLSFVLILTIAFGVAFQMPLVVLFLIRSGIVPAATFRKYRKVTILVIVFIAGCLAPPDLASHLLLSVPMWLLFEVGLWLGARAEARDPVAPVSDR